MKQQLHELLQQADEPPDTMPMRKSANENVQNASVELSPPTVTALTMLVDSEGRPMLNALAHMLVSGNGQQSVYCAFALLSLVRALPWQAGDFRLVESKLREACMIFASTAAGVALAAYHAELLSLIGGKIAVKVSRSETT